MKTQAYFENIQEQIKKELSSANSSIKIAVAWFTDAELFWILCQKAEEGLDVELMLMNDEINNASGINYNLLQNVKGKVWLIDSSKETPLMHNKFCIIDNDVIINGSYNWTNRAKTNHESITVIKENIELVNNFLTEFEKIKSTYFGKTADNEPIDFSKICLRLEALKNAILLEDKDDIRFQIAKTKNILNSLSDSEQKKLIDHVIALTDHFNYSDAINRINDFFNNFRALIRFVDEELAALKLEARALEIQISTLEDEIIEIEKLIHDFEVAYNTKLGELILIILELRKEKFKKEAEKESSKHHLYEEAEKDFNDFQNNYEVTKTEKRIELSEAGRKEIKEKFRKASKYCHPDVVSDQFKEEAEQMFISLKDAYDKNDIEKVRSILTNLEKGIYYSNSQDLNEANALKSIIIVLRQKRVDLENKIESLKESALYIEIISIRDWNIYMLEKKSYLLNELEKLTSDV